MTVVEDVPHFSILRRMTAMAAMRCPRCCRGAVYSGPLRMRRACEECHLQFEREPGYFTGAMYASYFLGIVTTLPVWLGMLVAGTGLGPILGVAVALVALLMPLYFHYSRVMWMHVDAYFNPKTFASDTGSHSAA
jgi:uncharacterized protein (DUF983 family)